MSIDLELERLDNGMHDLVIRDFDLNLVNELDQIKQNISIRLQFFFEEWFLDSFLGIRYFDFIFVQNPNTTLISSIIKTAILATPGVVKLLEYRQDLDRTKRSLTLSFRVDTVFGIVDNTETIGV